MVQIRRAARHDLDRVASLLDACSLPHLPADLGLANVLVALEDDVVVGAIALEVSARQGLLRSTVVSETHRNRGVGASLVRAIVARAHELGLRELHLLTESADAAGFFGGLGFAAVDRASVPREVRATREFREQCSESATVMRLPLATRF